MRFLKPLLLAAWCWAGSAQAGTAIVIGGALRADNDAVWQRIVDEAGGAGARIAVFATAAGNPERSAATIVAALNRRGAQAEAIPVAPRLAGVDLQANLRDPVLLDKVRNARGVFFSGGAQAYIVDSLQPGGQPTEMLQAIRSVLDRGGVIAGSSAGAAIMSRMMFRDPPGNHLILKGQWREGKEFDRGLAFIEPDVFVDQHFLKRGRVGRLLPAMRALGFKQGLGIEENSAAVFKGQQVEIIGPRGALLVDLSEASSDPEKKAFNLRGAQLSYLDRGDRHDFGTGISTPSAAKLREPMANAAAPNEEALQQGNPYFMDILGDQTIVNAMAFLFDTGLPEVRGLAYQMRPRPGDPAPDLGFEFRLYRGPGSAAWFSSAQGGEDVTVLKVRLDVIPVRLAQPLLSPL